MMQQWISTQPPAADGTSAPSSRYRLVRPLIAVSTEIPSASDHSPTSTDTARISVSGEIRPLGAEATERLHYQSGDHRVLPSPESIVWMHRVSHVGNTSVGGAKALVREANRALAFIHERATKGGYSDALAKLRAFTEGLGKPFHGAGPRGDGALDVERVAQNALRHFPTPEVAEAALGRMLHEYVGFALFAAWARANDEDQVELDRVVTRHLNRLRTKGCVAAA